MKDFGQPLWQPSKARIANSQLTAFESGLPQTFENYAALHQWSIDHPEDFWAHVWKFCGVVYSKPYTDVLQNSQEFPGAIWFADSQLNFAENLLRYQDDKIALIGVLENGQRYTLSYQELYSEVQKLASSLRAHGIKQGDRVAGLMPNMIEAVVAMLATISIGAIWTSCSPDFGVKGVCDRFEQIEPKLLFCTPCYLYNGKKIDCLENIKQIQSRLPTLAKTILVSMLDDEIDLTGLSNAQKYNDFLDHQPEPLVFAQLPFDHPLYINYSSGTTGVPKCIVHSAGGTLVQHLKEHQLHLDVTRDDVLFYFTTCGWMMWNWLVSGLASGCTLVLFDGSPFADQGRILLDAIDEHKITIFGTSAKYISALEKQGHQPSISHDLGSLKTILSTGSPLNGHSYDYVYKQIKRDVCLSSISGGTDIISCFMLGNPNLPVYRGEIQCLGLGMAVQMWNDDGNAVQREKGELVCVKPFPSTPIGFWNDDDQDKFHAAYFDDYPGVWAHGDYGEITKHDGVIIHGRSDAVLNPGGVRIGTAEIYRQVEKIPEVIDSVVIGQEVHDDIRVVLFVVLAYSTELDSDLIERIKQTIKTNTTPRHVPQKVIQVVDIPRTISGKTVELAVKNVVHNRAVKNRDALANPEALKYFENLDELEL